MARKKKTLEVVEKEITSKDLFDLRQRIAEEQRKLVKGTGTSSYEQALIVQRLRQELKTALGKVAPQLAFSAD